jgi:hypothetical protein
MKVFILFSILIFPITSSFGQLTIHQIDKKLDSLQTAKLTTQQRIALTKNNSSKSTNKLQI